MFQNPDHGHLQRMGCSVRVQLLQGKSQAQVRGHDDDTLPLFATLHRRFGPHLVHGQRHGWPTVDDGMLTNEYDLAWRAGHCHSAHTSGGITTSISQHERPSQGPTGREIQFSLPSTDAAPACGGRGLSNRLPPTKSDLDAATDAVKKRLSQAPLSAPHAR